MKKFLLLILFGSFLVASEIQWQQDYESALKTAQATKRPIFMFVESEDCFFCKEMKKKTLTKEKVISTLNTEFVPLKVMQGDGRYPESKYPIKGTPTIFFISPDQEWYMSPLLGYANEFKMLKKLAKGYE